MEMMTQTISPSVDTEEEEENKLIIIKNDLDKEYEEEEDDNEELDDNEQIVDNVNKRLNDKINTKIDIVKHEVNIFNKDINNIINDQYNQLPIKIEPNIFVSTGICLSSNNELIRSDASVSKMSTMDCNPQKLHQSGVSEVKDNCLNLNYPFTMENGVKYLQSVNFSLLTINEQTEIASIGRPTPMLSIQQNSVSRTKEYTRQFNMNVYGKCHWVCGCDQDNSLFCFPCLLFGGDSSWTKSGVTDLRHLAQKIIKHGQSAKHLNNIIDLSLIGKVNNVAHIDTVYKLSIVKHNKQVRKNRDVLYKIINCLNLCGKLNLPLEGPDEAMTSKIPGIFCGLVDFTCEMDDTLDPLIFKGTTFVIQDELLQSMFEIIQIKIKEEVKMSEYLSLICDEITDRNEQTQVVIILRYELCGKPVERFWGFVKPINKTAEALANILLKQLQKLIGNRPQKLISQTYDGTAAITGDKSVQMLIKEVYNNAHFVHSYVHQLHSILEKAASQYTDVRLFVNGLSGICEFFSNCPERIATLENVMSNKIPPSPSLTMRNFKNRTVKVIHQMKDSIIECCQILESSKSSNTGSAAAGIKRIMNDPEFDFWFEYFSKLMPHVDVIFSQLQSRNIDTVKVNSSLVVFNSVVEKLKEEYKVPVSPSEQKKRKFNTDKLSIATEVCDLIELQCRERFRFTGHLEANKLLLVNNFPLYVNKFPNNELSQTIAAYPWLDKDKLKSELCVLYTRGELCKSENLCNLLATMNDAHLQSTFSDTVKLLKILITIPMITIERERCFSTLMKVKTFLQSTSLSDKMSDFAMISIENEMITEIKDFNDKVINHFATSKTRRNGIIYK